MLLLLAAACDGTAGRALRIVAPPPDDDGRFTAYQRQRAASRPLLWPAAQDYARQALPGPHAQAVVTVPTGSGKSSVAELAISQALGKRWVLYLAPTNALVAQIRRHTAEVFGTGAVRDFLGGAEYTQLEGESLADVGVPQILVMTPEKCSLLLRQNPDAFANLGLCVPDEAHLLGDRGGRGVIAELVIAEVMYRAPQARLLLMSALVANPRELADWLHQATGQVVTVIDEPWRPTRTTRAIAGIDRVGAMAAKNSARQKLSTRSASRVNEEYRAPIALRAGLQGAWRSPDAEDYLLVKTDIDLHLSVNRAGATNTDGYCTPATVAIVQRLGDHDDKVLAFLPANKHYSFIAANMTKFGAGDHFLGETVMALLFLADLELGVPSALRDTLSHRVAVHTSALLREEQRASEVAFDTNVAVAMYATGTMAQGLNLPATAVVIGGTDIGYDPTSDTQQRKDNTRNQLLNAIGRAGRAHVAARSMAIVVPNKAIDLDSAEDAMRAVRTAEFLQDDDASAAVVSRLDGLVRDALTGELDVDTMSDSEQTAFSFLSFASDREDAAGVIGKTWAVHRADARDYAAGIAGLVTNVGEGFLRQAHVPSWVALAAHQSGIPLPETAAIYGRLRAHLADHTAPQTIPAWADLMLDILSTLNTKALSRVLPKASYGASRLAGIYDTDPAKRRAGWNAYLAALRAWMAGEPMITIAESVHTRDVNANAGRGALDPIPRVLAVCGDGFRFGLSLVAGSLAALIVVGSAHEPDSLWTLPTESLRTLHLPPLAVRSGADRPEVVAWMRAGVSPRVAAHILNAVEAPPDGQNDDQLQRWAHGRFKDMSEGAIAGLTDEQTRIVQAVQASRDAS